jgi:hypothetical protein
VIKMAFNPNFEHRSPGDSPVLEERRTITSMREQGLERIRAEYLEMPGMRLKLEQVQRLCGIERSICEVVLDSLVEAKFLCVRSDGRYARLADGEVPPARPSRADLDTRSALSAPRSNEFRR